MPRGFPRKGVGVKKSSLSLSIPSKVRSLLPGISLEFAGVSRTLYWPHIARYCGTIAAIPHIARYLFREVSSSTRWCDTPLVLSFTQAHLCNTPFCNISRDYCVIPHKNRHQTVLRYYRYKHPAIRKESLLASKEIL